MKIAIVAPAHIPLTKDWIYSLEREAKIGGADVFIVDDSDGKLGDLPTDWVVFGYEKQKKFLGELYDEFAKVFHKSSACRIFGHIFAYAENYDIVIGLDSDCVVPFHFVSSHISILNNKKAYGWSNPLGTSGWYPRGYPYSMRNWPVKANMGMWENVLDLNGKDRKENEPKHLNVSGHNIAPAPIPFSGMNFALTRDVLFGFLFLPNFIYQEQTATAVPKTWEFRRIDDIWGGYIFQKLLRKLKMGVTYGQPIVFHDTVVVPAEDTAEEEAMYKYEDEFTQEVDNVVNAMILNPQDMTDAMRCFIDGWGDTGTYKMFSVLEWWGKVITKYV